MTTDTARKLPREGILLLDELQLDLKRHGIETTQKELIVESIKLAAVRHYDLRKQLEQKNNRKQMTRALLSSPKFNFGRRWLEDIDTTT